LNVFCRLILEPTTFSLNLFGLHRCILQNNSLQGIKYEVSFRYTIPNTPNWQLYQQLLVYLQSNYFLSLQQIDS
jgi:hypothetical protein